MATLSRAWRHPHPVIIKSTQPEAHEFIPHSILGKMQREDDTNTATATATTSMSICVAGQAESKARTITGNTLCCLTHNDTRPAFSSEGVLLATSFLASSQKTLKRDDTTHSSVGPSLPVYPS